MKRKLTIGILCIWMLAGCSDENPVPNSFLEYQYPSFQLMDDERLKSLDGKIREGDFGDIHSLIILRNDKIVFENYYSNYRRSDLHPIGGATQSVISTLVGAVLHEDSTLSLRQEIIDFLPDYTQYFENVPQKDQIQLRHLLTNTSGLWWDEWSHPFGNEDNDAYQMTLSDDWVGNVLSTPMIREPGDEFNYNSGNGILMAPILQHITGVELEEYAAKTLFDPLEITEWKWERIPGDFVNASWGLHMRPLDLAKIGYLHLKDGVWDDQVIFDEFWRLRSSRYREWAIGYLNYSYFWWRFSGSADVVRNINPNDVFFAWGDGGQFMFIIPHLEVVVVTTAGNFGNNETIAFSMLQEYIFDSISDLIP